MVILGAAIGAPARYLTDRAVQARHRSLFPWGTFTVNIFACFVLGILTGAISASVASPAVGALVGTGFCGTLSTYSTFSFETLRLAERGAMRLAVSNVAASLTVGVGAAFLGTELAQTLWR